MKLIKREIIELSEKEDCAFQVISDAIEDIVKESDDSALINDAMQLNTMLIQFYQNYCQED